METKVLLDALKNYKESVECYEKKNEIESIDFNIFNLIENVFGLSEPKHSKIIAFLLNPHEIHGQKETFLHLFLEMLDIKDYKDNIWNVYAEKGNVDILIKSDFPTNRTVIVENKSNWAIDQSNQLYRYWYQNIFKNNQYNNQDCFNPDKNRIIYLSPSKYKFYSRNSISRPDSEFDFGPEFLDEKIINTWYFQGEFKSWLLKCIESAKSERLKLFIKDYISYWDETNNKYQIIMEDLGLYFSDKKDDWVAFKEMSGYIDSLESIWVKVFEERLQTLCEEPSWIFDKATNDCRWFISEWNSLSFVYEPHMGLSLWKADFSDCKNNYKEEFISLFGDDFDFFNDTSNYIMALKNKSIVLDSPEKYWIIGNSPEIVLNPIKDVLDKYLKNDKVKEFFKKVDNDTK